MLCFQNEGHNQAGNLRKDIFLVYLTPSDIKSLAGLLNFDFRILWRNMKTKNTNKRDGFSHTARTQYTNV